MTKVGDLGGVAVPIAIGVPPGDGREGLKGPAGHQVVIIPKLPCVKLP